MNVWLLMMELQEHGWAWISLGTTDNEAVLAYVMCETIVQLKNNSGNTHQLAAGT